MENLLDIKDEVVVGRRPSNTPDTSQSIQQIETSANAQMATDAEQNSRGCTLGESPSEPSCSRRGTQDNGIEPVYSFELDEDAKFLRRSSLDRFDFQSDPDIDEPECSQSEIRAIANVPNQHLQICPTGNNANGDEEFLSLNEFLQNSQRYQLLEIIDEMCPYMRYAKDTSSDEKVIIISYRFRVSAEHLAPYRKMEECNSVPKLLSIIRPDDAQSFLVFQCGEYTLSDWMRDRSSRTAEQKREVLYQVLTAIADFHREEIVHGNLSLSTIMWFPDASWKLLFPMFIRNEQNVHHLVNSHWHPRSASPFTAPEVRKTISRKLDFPCDMWSFGVIASEILQDPSCACSLRPGAASVGGVGDYCSSRRKHKRIRNVQGAKAKELVKSLTSSFPKRRLKYKDAMEDAFFKPLRNPDLDVRVHQNWTAVLNSVMQLQRQHIELTRKHHAESRASDICADVSMEYFRRYSNPDEPFYSRKGRKVFKIRDSWLLQKSVPLLKVRESYRLRIALTNRQGSSVEALNITSVEVSVKGGRSQSLTRQSITADAHKHEVCAHLELDKLDSEKLKTVSPCFGELDDKYVALNVLIKFTTDGDGPVQQISQDIWCRMVSPKCIMVLPRILRAVTKGWRCLPTEVQGGALMLFIAAKFAVGL